GQLAVDIPAADLASGAVVQVTVFNPGPAGGTSDAATFTINNPVPSLVSLSPSSVSAGSAVFTLTLNGGNFVPTSVVRWNGAELAPPTFVSAFKLTVPVPAADIAAAHSASVTVFNGAPAGGTSGAATFTITPAPTFSLTVSVKGSAPGAVTSAAAAITCPATCSADFASGVAGVRAALEATYVAAGVTPPTYTDPTIAAGETVIKASHVTEARNAVRAIE